MKLPIWLKRLSSRVPTRARRRITPERALSKRELLFVAAVLLVPIPLFAATGLNLPLLGPVERGVASLLPGGWEEAVTYEIAPASDSIVLDGSSAGVAGLGVGVQPGNAGNPGTAGGTGSDEPSAVNVDAGASEGAQVDEGTGSSSASGASPSSPPSRPPSSGGGGGNGGGGNGGGGNGGGSGAEDPDAATDISIAVGGVGGVTISGSLDGSGSTPEADGGVAVDTPVEGGDVTVDVPDPGDVGGDLTGGTPLPSSSAGASSSGLPLDLPVDLPVDLPLPIDFP